MTPDPQVLRMMSDLLSSIVEKLGKYLAGPDRGGDAVGLSLIHI